MLSDRKTEREGNMILKNEELQKIWFGAYSFEETEDGFLQAFQYTKEQMKYFSAVEEWYVRCFASSAKTLEFLTNAERISFEYRIIWEGSQDTFELEVNGLPVDIRYVKDLPDEGKLEFILPAGEKKAVVYLPADATVLLKNFEIDGSYVPAKKGPKVLWLGDSITQGYGPLRSYETYVSVANRILGYDILNQGIGGYIYDRTSVVKMEGYVPEKIIVALGTNQYGDDRVEDVEEFYERLIQVYGDEIRILCITPIWRGDKREELPKLREYCELIKKVAGRYKNVWIVDGFSLVPHLSEYFLDDLHPNCLGTEIYGRNLADIIKTTGF